MKKACTAVPQQDYPECEKTWAFAPLMVGGYLGPFPYVLRGGVFCSAQTGNLVLLALPRGEGNWSRALYLSFQLPPVSSALWNRKPLSAHQENPPHPLGHPVYHH